MAPPSSPQRVIGRYALFDEIASGGMATVHYGRMTGPAGFARTVAVKRLHPQFAKAPEFVAMLIDEARLAARVRHPNVISMIDVVATEDEMLLVMDYVQGLTLSHLLRQAGVARVPLEVAVAILGGALDGLHAAHEACGEDGTPLGIVHRDVSPQNILVGSDGVPRVADFGIAKATGRLQTTRDGQIKGKTAYMAPEQIRAQAVDRRTDVYAASVVLWETLAGRRLFTADSAAGIMNAILEGDVPSVVTIRPDVPAHLDEVLRKGLSLDPGDRFATAREMAVALERALRPASVRDVGDWIVATAAGVLERRARQVADMEASSSDPGRIAGGVLADVPGKAGGEAEPQTTASSLVSDAQRAPRKTRAFTLAALAVAGLIGAAVAFASVRVRSPSASAVQGEESAQSAAPTTSAPPAIRTGSPSASAPSTVPVASSPPPVPAPHRRTRPAGTPSRPHLDCNPPYEIDPDGTRHWKNGC